ncbi:MAG: hypothetical protein IJ367_03020 [Clostridia bacterium]|nr:hypothetical protein [Clostridia bacterium]
MDAKEWLARAWQTEKMICLLEDETEDLRRLNRENLNLDAVHLSDTYRKELHAYADEMLKIKIEVYHTIMAVQDFQCRTVLMFRYLRYHTWEAIAGFMKLDLRQVYRLHVKALEMVEEIIRCTAEK